MLANKQVLFSFIILICFEACPFSRGDTEAQYIFRVDWCCKNLSTIYCQWFNYCDEPFCSLEARKEMGKYLMLHVENQLGV